jgi:hypothetical protein
MKPMIPIALVVLLGGVLLILALFVSAGRYQVSDAMRLSDTTGGVFVIDRFTGNTRYCGVTRGTSASCSPVAEHAAAN